MSRVAIVTGVLGGIGRATAARFARLGWTVVGLDRTAESAEGVARSIACDVGDEAAVRQAFADIAAEHAAVHALVNNAAVQLGKPLAETRVEEWDEVMGSNARSVFLGLKHGQALLARAGGAAVVNVASVHALATSKGVAAYAASKGAVLALTRAAALELAPLQIRVNAVLPGAVDTPMLHAGLRRGAATAAAEAGARLAELSARTALGRVADPDEIARAIVFLADGTQSSFMTGQALVVDGGATARLSTE
jgi:glucose 1-dehydrogenase